MVLFLKIDLKEKAMPLSSRAPRLTGPTAGTGGGSSHRPEGSDRLPRNRSWPLQEQSVIPKISSPSTFENATTPRSSHGRVNLCSLVVHPIPITAGQEKSQPLIERGCQGSIPSSAYRLAVPSHGPSLCLHLPAIVSWQSASRSLGRR